MSENTPVKFKKGKLADLPETKEVGTFYVTTDTRGLYIDISDSERIRIDEEVTKVSQLENDSGYLTVVPDEYAKDTIIYIGEVEPTDPETVVWINTAEDSAEASAVEAHNIDENSHADIRAAIPTTPADLGLTTEALTFYYEDGTSRVVEVYVK